jgi:PadR family transcriptional regulator, regulatory protein PadR
MNTNLENAKAQMRKGVLELCILSIIAEREAYPSDIIERLKSSDLLVVEGTLYPILTRMKDSGYLEYRWIETGEAPMGLGEPKKGGGPPRKYYNLTEAGSLALADMQTAWSELVSSVDKITSKVTLGRFKKEKVEDTALMEQITPLEQIAVLQDNAPETPIILSNENEIV